MSEQPNTQRHDGHLTIYVAWPVLAGAALATVLAVSVGGMWLLIAGDWRGAGIAAAGVWFVVLSLATVTVFVYAAKEWSGPRRQERIEKTRQEVIEVLPESLEPPPPMILRGFSPALLPATVDHTVESIAPAVDPEVDHLYRFILDAWQHDDVTQAGCMSRGWRRKDWDKFVGGSRRRADLGKDSARGLLDRAGIIRKDGNSWVTCATLEQALHVNDQLLTYAESKAKMIRLDKSDKSSQVKAAGMTGVSDLAGVGEGASKSVAQTAQKPRG